MKKRIAAFAMALSMVLGVTAVAVGGEKAITVSPMTLTINGQNITPTKSDGTPAQVFAYDGATYVPLRYLSELLGINVDWSAEAAGEAKLSGLPTSVGANTVVTGSAQGFGGQVIATVTVSGGKVVSCTLEGTGETPAIGGAALPKLQTQVTAAGGPEIDGVSGATITSNAVKEAVASALRPITGKAADDAVMADGVYTGTGPAYGGNVTVSVTVKDHAISSIEIMESFDTKVIGGEAYPQLTQAVIETQSLGVDSISGATVSSNGFIAAMSDAVTKAGGDAIQLRSKAVVKRTPIREEYTSDILVIGGGMAGLTAAIKAADEGAHVILVEKLGVLGGSTTRSEGYVMGADTSYQKENGVYDTTDKFFNDIYSIYKNEPALDANLLKKVIYDSKELIPFLQENGVKFQKLAAVSTLEPRATPRNHCTEGKGGGLTSYLYQSAISKGVTVYMNTPATEILQDNGVVVGAKATNQYGDDLTFHADATILCAGSYGGNVEMMKQLNPNIKAEMIKGCGDGDGFTLAENAGAKMLLLDYPQLQYYFYWNGVPDLPVYPASAIRPVHNVLLTDGVGKRVANEADFNFEFNEQVYQSGQQEGYCIVGQKFYEQYPEVCEAGLGKTFPVRGDGIAFKADTVAELAQWAGLDPQVLTETVNRYNELCDLGQDLDFGKDPTAMERVDGPYYILKLPAIVTDGYSGTTINENAQVIGINGKPIPGFYAAGCCAVPQVSCVNYYGCGTSLVTCGVFGMAAAQHACDTYVK